MSRFKHIFWITLFFLPKTLLAEGQSSFTVILAIFDLFKVFIPWLILISFGIFSYQKISGNQLDKKKKTKIYILSGILALFIWSMVIHDSKPFEGPIDSIIYLPNGEPRF